MGTGGGKARSMLPLAVVAAAVAILFADLGSERSLGPGSDVALASTLSDDWFIPGAENGPTTTTTVRIHNPQGAPLLVRQRLFVAGPNAGNPPTCEVVIAGRDTVDSCITAAHWGTHTMGTIYIDLASAGAVLAVDAYLTKQTGTHGSKVQTIERRLGPVGVQ